MGLAFTHAHYKAIKGHPYTKHCICCLPLHIYWIYYYYFSFSLLFLPSGYFFLSLQSMQSIVTNCIFLILIVIVLLLFGVVIDKIKVVVVIKFNHIRVGKTICCKLEGQRNFWKCFSLRHFGQLCILSIPDAIKRI